MQCMHATTAVIFKYQDGPQGAKLSYLTRHADKLMGMADDKSLRREVASFPLASTAPDPMPAEDRSGLMPVLVHLMWPRLRKRSGKQAKKGGAGSSRTAVLHFLAGMQPSELRHLVQLVLQPVTGAMRGGVQEPAATQASHVTASEPRYASLEYTFGVSHLHTQVDSHPCMHRHTCTRTRARTERRTWAGSGGTAALY